MITLPDDKSNAATGTVTPSGHDHSNTLDFEDLPPDYSEATASPSTSNQSPLSFSEHSGSSTSESVPPAHSTTESAFTPLARPTNYLSIRHLNSSIDGVYSINPTLPAPPGAATNLNLQLVTQNGSIKTIVEIVRGVDSKGPARLEMQTQNGHVDATVIDRGENRFRLHVTTQNGSATICIPSTFIGSIHARMLSGQVQFSPDVQQHVTILSEVDNERRYFIGDFTANGYQDEETWHMDHLYIEAQNGNATIQFASDEPSLNGTSRGFFGRFFSKVF